MKSIFSRIFLLAIFGIFSLSACQRSVVVPCPDDAPCPGDDGLGPTQTPPSEDDDDTTGDDDIVGDDDTDDDDTSGDDDTTGDDDTADADGDGTPDATDCAPSNDAIHPGATEDCDDTIDNNCDGLVDSVDASCATADDDDEESAGGLTADFDCPRDHEPLAVQVYTPSLANMPGVVFNFCRDDTIDNAADCVEPSADWVEPGYVAENAGFVVAELCVRPGDVVRFNTSYYNTALAFGDGGEITVSASRWLCEGSGDGARLTALVDVAFRDRQFTEADLGEVSLGGGCSAWFAVSDLVE